MSEEQALIPIEQQTLLFYGKPIIVVLLLDERPAVILRLLCENLQIPEILERLGPQTLTPAHQRQVQIFAHQLSQLTKKSYATIYDDLKTAFSVAKYSDIPEEAWVQVEQWFNGQIERARKKLK